MVKKESYVKKEDFDKLTDIVTQVAKSINDLKNICPTYKKEEEHNGKTIEPEKPVQIDEEPDVSPVPPAWRKMVDEALGPDFGINVSYPQSGSGFLFKIIVPPEKSNASKSHKEFYKTDIRTKAISYSDGIDGVRKYCELVAANLKRK